MLVESAEGIVAEHNHFVEITPKGVKLLVVGTPFVAVKALPEAAIVPVGPANRDDGLIGGKGVVVVNTAIGALKSVAIGLATDVIVELSDGVEIQTGGRIEDLRFRKTVARLVVETREEQRSNGQQNSCEREKRLDGTHEEGSCRCDVRTVCSCPARKSGREGKNACRRCLTCCSRHGC